MLCVGPFALECIALNAFHIWSLSPPDLCVTMSQLRAPKKEQEKFMECSDDAATRFSFRNGRFSLAHAQRSPHPLLSLIGDDTSLEFFGFNPRVKQPELSVEEAVLLKDLTDVLKTIRDETQIWLYTSSKTTIEALTESHSIVLAMTSALSADEHRVERLISIVKDRYRDSFTSSACH